MRRWAFGAAGLVILALVVSGDTPWRTRLTDSSLPLILHRTWQQRASLHHTETRTKSASLEPCRIDEGAEEQGYPHFPHPPMLFLLLLPIAHLTLSQAAFV